MIVFLTHKINPKSFLSNFWGSLQFQNSRHYLFNLYSENDKILALIGDHLLIIYLKMYNTVLSPPYILWYILCLYLELFPSDTKY